MDIELLNCCSFELCGPFLLITFLLQDASNNDAPQEVKVTSPDEENQGAQDQKEENQDDMQPRSEEQVQQEVTISEEMHQETYEQQEQQLPQVPVTEIEQDQEVPVHQGQPEI